MTGGSRTELHARLLELCDGFRAAGQIGCEVALDASHTCFGEEISEVVYRAIHELLVNVRRHAQATRVELSSVRRRDGSIGIVVADNGVGLPPHRRRGKPSPETGGTGLWTIDRRLRDFDAMLDVEAVEGQGTRAMVIVPARFVVCD